jgi:hypothetical protein
MVDGLSLQQRRGWSLCNMAHNSASKLVVKTATMTTMTTSHRCFAASIDKKMVPDGL